MVMLLVDAARLTNTTRRGRRGRGGQAGAQLLSCCRPSRDAHWYGMHGMAYLARSLLRTAWR